MLGFRDRTRAILDAVDRLGSVSAAARAVGLDPSNALRHVRTAERRSGAKLLDRAKGGAARGGASLTAAGRRLIERGRDPSWVARAGPFDEGEGTTPLHLGRRLFHAAGRHPPGPVEVRLRPEDVALARAMTAGSARNLLRARVAGVSETPEGTWRVRLAAGDLTLEATVTRGAVRALGLRPGRRVVASFKASALRVRPLGTG